MAMNLTILQRNPLLIENSHRDSLEKYKKKIGKKTIPYKI